MNTQWIKQVAFFLLLGTTSPILAQEVDRRAEERSVREIPSPENNASSILKDFTQVFKLTGDKYEKVHQLYLKHEKSIMPDFGNGNMPEGGMRGPRPGGGGPGGPGGGGMCPGGGMPPQGGFQPGMGGDDSSDRKKMMEERLKEETKKREKAAKTLSKKMKKLLDSNQYEQWLQWEETRKSKQRSQFNKRQQPQEGEFPAMQE